MLIIFNYLVKILWFNIYDRLMFVGLKLFNCEDSEIKNCIVFYVYMYSIFWMFWVRCDILYRCIYVMMYYWLILRIVWKEKKKKKKGKIIYLMCWYFIYRGSVL